MSATAFHDYGRILRVTTTQRTPRLLKGLAWLTAVLWVAMLLARLGGKFPELELAPGALLRQLVFAAALALIVAWSMVFLPGTVMVYAAASARMLPRQRRRLFQLAYGSWVLLCAMLALSIDKWGLFLAAGAMSLSLGLVYSGRSAGVWLFVSGLGAAALSSFLPPPAATALGTSAGQATLCALLLAVGWFALRTHYPAEGSERMRLRTVIDPLGMTADPHGGGGLWAGTASVLRRAIRARNPQDLLAHGMGPAFHWASAALVPAGMLALLLAVWAVMTRYGIAAPKDAAGGMMGGLIGTATWSLGLQSHTLRKQLAARRGEHALLRLAPLVGDSAVLNRRLAGAMLKSAVLCWLLTTAMYLTMLAAAGATPRQLEIVLAICCASGQFGLAHLLDDFARRPVPKIDERITTFGLLAAQVVVTVAFGSLAGFSGWRWLAALSVAVTIVQVRFGWRRLVTAPPALPAGRMEKEARS